MVIKSPVTHAKVHYNSSDPRSVVTAAHCQFPVSRFLVVLGEHDLQEDEDTELRMVPASWTTHPLYNPR